MSTASSIVIALALILVGMLIGYSDQTGTVTVIMERIPR